MKKSDSVCRPRCTDWYDDDDNDDDDDDDL